MFNVYVHDGTSKLPTDDICYIVAKEGIFLKKKTGIMESIAPVKGISILESVQSAASMNIKKIPGGQFAQVIAFFREVYKKFYSEAIILLFYDEERRVYKLVAPHQKVTSAACDYDKGLVIEGMQMIGTIHSHASMSAFHSGVDDKDEEHFDGLHITIGHMRDDNVSVTASIVANGHRFVVDPLDYVDRLQLTVDIDEVEQRPTRRIFRWVDGKMVEDTEASSKSTYTYRKFDKRYAVNVSSKYHKVPNGWMDMVEKGVYHYNYSGYGGLYGGGGGYYGRQAHNPGNRNWGSRYDSSLWNQMLPAKTGQVAKTTTPQTQRPIKPIEFPPHDVDIEGDDNELIPCETCVFRAHKFLAEQDGTDFEPEIYICEKCKEIIVDDTDSLVIPECSKCKTDEYLSLVTEDELPSHYVNSKDYSHLKTEPGIKADSQFVTCGVCGTGFHTLGWEEKCPFCHSDLNYDSEQALEKQSLADSGPLTDDAETDRINELAIQEAQLADQTIERIPDPTEAAIPITEKPGGVQDEDNAIKRMLRSVFGGKK